jgi:hypothetical protein
MSNVTPPAGAGVESDTAKLAVVVPESPSVTVASATEIVWAA